LDLIADWKRSKGCASGGLGKIRDYLEESAKYDDEIASLGDIFRRKGRKFPAIASEGKRSIGFDDSPTRRSVEGKERARKHRPSVAHPFAARRVRRY
jgi:hypothetical protein